MIPHIKVNAVLATEESFRRTAACQFIFVNQRRVKQNSAR